MASILAEDLNEGSKLARCRHVSTVNPTSRWKVIESLQGREGNNTELAALGLLEMSWVRSGESVSTRSPQTDTACFTYLFTYI